MFSLIKQPTRKEGQQRRAQTLIRRLWSALETKKGHRLTSKELSSYLNISDTALGDWFAGKTELYQIEAVLKLCELLGLSESTKLLRQSLRTFPTLNSPELAHDPATVDRVRRLLLKTAGLSFIVGGNSTQRGFLFGAIGNSYREIAPTIHSLAGWDIHAPTWFVPLSGLLYMPDEHTQPGMLREEAVRHHLILSNGLWERSESHRAHLISLARSNHVVVASSVTASGLRENGLGVRAACHLMEIGGDAERVNVTLVECPKGI